MKRNALALAVFVAASSISSAQNLSVSARWTPPFQTASAQSVRQVTYALNTGAGQAVAAQIPGLAALARLDHASPAAQIVVGAMSAGRPADAFAPASNSPAQQQAVAQMIVAAYYGEAVPTLTRTGRERAAQIVAAVKAGKMRAADLKTAASELSVLAAVVPSAADAEEMKTVFAMAQAPTLKAARELAKNFGAETDAVVAEKGVEKPFRSAEIVLDGKKTPVRFWGSVERIERISIGEESYSVKERNPGFLEAYATRDRKKVTVFFLAQWNEMVEGMKTNSEEFARFFSNSREIRYSVGDDVFITLAGAFSEERLPLGAFARLHDLKPERLSKADAKAAPKSSQPARVPAFVPSENTTRLVLLLQALQGYERGEGSIEDVRKWILGAQDDGFRVKAVKMLAGAAKTASGAKRAEILGVLSELSRPDFSPSTVRPASAGSFVKTALDFTVRILSALASLMDASLLPAALIAGLLSVVGIGALAMGATTGAVAAFLLAFVALLAGLPSLPGYSEAVFGVGAFAFAVIGAIAIGATPKWFVFGGLGAILLGFGGYFAREMWRAFRRD